MLMISIAAVFFVMMIQSSAFLRSRVNHLNYGYKINRKLLTLTKSSIQDNNAFFRAGSFHKIAILIDGDNAEASLVAEFIAEAGRFGKVTVKRIYADWTSPLMKGWKEQLNSYAVRPIQKFAYTKHKSSTDTALIIDAMDLLHSKLVDGFCIVSSDSDYTGLAHRIREEGLFIMGIGRSHTPEAFIKACESFTYSEILSSSLTESMSSTSSLAERILMSSSAASVIGLEPLTSSSSSSSGRGDKKAYKALNSSSSSSASSRAANAAAIANAAAAAAAVISPTSSFKKLNIDLNKVDRAFRIAMNIDTGHCMLSRLSEELRKLDPTFDHRNFGYPSFRKFCEALQPNYEIFYGNGKDGKDFSTLYIMESCNNNNNNNQQHQPLLRQQQQQSTFSSQQQQQLSTQDAENNNVVLSTSIKSVNLPPLTSSSKSAQKANAIKLESASSSVTTGTTRKSTTSTKKELETVIAVASTISSSSITTTPAQQRSGNTVVTKQMNNMDTSVIKLERSKMMEENNQQVNNVDDDDEEDDANDLTSDVSTYSSNNKPIQSSMMSVVEEAGDADVDLAMSSSTSSSTNAVMNGMRVSERRLQSKMKAIEKEMMALLDFDSSPTSTSDDDDKDKSSESVENVKQQPRGIVLSQISEGSNRNPYFDTSELYFTNPDANNLDDVDKAIFIPTLSSSTVVTSTDKLMKASSVTAVKERERELEKESMTRLKALRAREVARKKRAEEEIEALWYFSRYEDD